MSINQTRQLWTPTVGFATPGDLSVAYTVQKGVWFQTDSLLYVGFQLSFTPTYTTASGNFQILGFPRVFSDNIAVGGFVNYLTNAVLPHQRGVHCHSG
jgi:hypothetical protein